jgi:MFS family permease
MSNHWAVTQTLAGPGAAGRWTGLQNFFGNLAGVVAPALAGYLVDRSGHMSWTWAIAGLVAWSGAIGWILLVPEVRELNWAGDVDGRSIARVTPA